MTRRAARTGRFGLRGPVILVVGIALAACQSAAVSPIPSVGVPEAAPTPVVTEYDLGTVVWIDGFVVTVHTAIASLDEKGGPVSVTLRIENPGQDAATLDAPIRLTASGAAFELAHGTELPEIPAGGAAELTIEFEVVGRSAINDGVLRIGRVEDHQVQVPFGPGAVQLLTLEPIDMNLTGAGAAGNLRFALHRAVVRWDLPDWHTELPNGTAALTVTYDATYTGDFAGGFAFTGDNVRLRLPDGTILAPRADGHSQPILLLAPKQTGRSLETRFEIPTGLTGRFALIVIDGAAQKAIPFTIGP